MPMAEEYDVIVVGSGVGGATVAREMARRGRRVMLLERGGRFEMMGFSLSMAAVLRRYGLTMSREGNHVTFADHYGGASNLAAGCAFPPPPSVFAPFGIDLNLEAEEAAREMRIGKLPDELIGEANLRLLDAAHAAGYQWEKLDNFIDPATCRRGCGDCMLGCRTGAKWTARVYGDEAVRLGAALRLHAAVSGVIVENGRAVGVRGRRLGRPFAYFGNRIVLSAGMDNAHILRRAGIGEAGIGFCCDWLQFVGGIVPGITSVGSNPMTVGTKEHYEADGMLIVPVFPNWAQFLVMTGMMGPSYWTKLKDFRKYTGIMVKIRDERTGEILSGTGFSKPITDNDRKKLDKGVGIISRILCKAGAHEDSIFALKPSGAHPSASCRIGEVVDADLETRIHHLYCCDASVLPSALGAPLIWTIAALGKRLAKHLHREMGSNP
jgi:choline dehydrogenase-like flavoprotein